MKSLVTRRIKRYVRHWISESVVWVASLIAGLVLSANGLGLMLGAVLTFGFNSAVAREPSALAWMTFCAVILSLLATLAGALAGRRRTSAHVGSRA